MLKHIILTAALLATALPALAQPAQSPAQNPSGQTPEVQTAMAAMRQACAADVATLCDGITPGGGKILKCLKDHRDQVSVGCKIAGENLRAARQPAAQ
jgi:Cysteine rich repeat